jgi:GNAT superfamily N-acetyltransferase
MEKNDYESLDDPEGYILNGGGHIFVALLEAKPVGVCALLKRKDAVYPYELAKMAVAPEARGKHIGWLLGQAIIEKTRELGGRNLFLESNTVLKPAISLYQKLGFKKIKGPPTPYERCNIQMELKL